MNKVDEWPNNTTIVVVLVLLVVGILTTGIQVVYGSCWRNILSVGGKVVIMQFGIGTIMAEHSGIMKCGMGIECVAGIEWSRR
jgi:hypothetical protein